ncbi:putative cytochrome P450 [Septoria linicola]|nr:putative cytochrome P450 [Septoria linicola]
MLELLTSMGVVYAVAVVIIVCLVRFIKQLHFQRSLLNGLPTPPRNIILGNIISMGKVLASQPRNAAPQTYMHCLKEYYKMPDVFYFDPWPLGPPLMAIFNVEMLNQITLEHNPPKHPLVREFIWNFGGPANLVSEDGAIWKRWRSAFNPGFSSSHLMTQVPSIVEECQVFCDIMTRHAKNNDLFRMENATTKLTVNIIGRIVLDVDLNAQRGANVLVDAFNSQVRWQARGAQFQPSELWDIRRPIIQTYNNWRMNKYVGARLDERFAGRQSRGRSKHVIDLALETYLKEKEGNDGDASKITELDSEFKQAAISNVKTMLFAGHDTTSSTICYAYYYLAKAPNALERIKKELADVFGPDPSQTAAKIIAEPHLLNKLEYTLAVIKEVLRLDSPASTIRVGRPGLTLHDPDTGENLPTEHFMLWPVNVGLHRNPKYWPEPDRFDPDRFVPGSAVYAANNKEAWVPFSKGTRNCIGQELAIIETKIILAMTLRTFDFQAAYDELDKLRGDGTGYPNATSGIQSQFGERAYQVQLGTAKPAEGMPCRLKLI